jgi:hypothetical protein
MMKKKRERAGRGALLLDELSTDIVRRQQFVLHALEALHDCRTENDKDRSPTGETKG